MSPAKKGASLSGSSSASEAPTVPAKGRVSPRNSSQLPPLYSKPTSLKTIQERTGHRSLDALGCMDVLQKGARDPQEVEETPVTSDSIIIIIGASLSEPHTYVKYATAVCMCIYIYIYIFIYMCRTSCRIVLFTHSQWLPLANLCRLAGAEGF